MIEHCIVAAKEEGFSKMYLETLPELNKAVKVYEAFGFNYLQQPLGNSGHSGCDIWMIKNI
jgi:putative acetyltransferase